MASQPTLLQTIIDVVGFIVISMGLVLRALIRMFLPSAYRPHKNFQGEVVLITGGGSGLGRLVALRLARLGAIIVIWDINETGADETVKLVEGIGGKAFGYKCNIADRENVYKVAEVTNKEAGQVTVLINNAGVVSGSLLLDTPDHLIQRTFDVNIVSHFWTTKAFLPKMIENNHGHIVTIASMAGHVGIKKLVDYCASKYAAVGFDESLRIELESQGIRGVKTSVICPYFIQATGMFDDVKSRFLPTLKSNDVADRIVLGIRREELFVHIPGIFRYTIWLKWLFPWGVVSMFLRNLVPDASPDKQGHTANVTNSNVTKITTKPLEKQIQGDSTLHQRPVTTNNERQP